jgi:AcrR family transcriptional regulator
MIAKEAGIALGTMYNYFRSKDELYTVVLSSIIIPEKESDNDETRSEDPDEIIFDFFKKHLMKMIKFGKKRFKEVISVVFNSMNKNPLLFKSLVKLDIILFKKLENLLKELIKKNLLSSDFDVEQVSFMLYSVSLSRMGFYWAYGKSYSEEQLFIDIDRDIRLILSSIKNSKN